MSKFGEPIAIHVLDGLSFELIDCNGVHIESYGYRNEERTSHHYRQHSRRVECTNACSDMDNPRQELNTIYHIAKAIASCRHCCPEALQNNIDKLQIAVQGLPR